MPQQPHTPAKKITQSQTGNKSTGSGRIFVASQSSGTSSASKSSDPTSIFVKEKKFSNHPQHRAALDDTPCHRVPRKEAVVFEEDHAMKRKRAAFRQGTSSDELVEEGNKKKQKSTLQEQSTNETDPSSRVR